MLLHTLHIHNILYDIYGYLSEVLINGLNSNFHLYFFIKTEHVLRTKVRQDDYWYLSKLLS